MEQRSEKFLRERKMMLILPLVAIPLLSLAFYGLGGGKGIRNSKDRRYIGKGINMSLPIAHFNARERDANKLGVYKKADLEAAKLRERMKEDPYYSKPLSGPDSDSFHLLPLGRPRSGLSKSLPFERSGLPASETADSQANQLLQKLAELKKVMNITTVHAKVPTLETSGPPSQNPVRIIPPINQRDTVPADPQLDKLSKMLDKILRIQHPEEGIGPDTSRSVTNPAIQVVGLIPNEPALKTLTEAGDNVDSDEIDGFMEISQPSDENSAKENLIAAVVDQDATLQSGATVSLRLTGDAEIGGVLIGRNSLLSGKVSVNGERFLVSVNSIRVHHTALQVALEVYDQDGLPGIRIPGAISRDVSKESVDAAMSGLGLTSLDPGLSAQAANAGLQAAKTMISRKAKLVRGAVPAGYQVFLKNLRKD